MHHQSAGRAMGEHRVGAIAFDSDYYCGTRLSSPASEYRPPNEIDSSLSSSMFVAIQMLANALSL